VPAEQVIGRNIRDRLLQDAAESVARAVEQTTNSARPSSVTFSVETAKGTFFYDALVVPFDADSSLMVARDVTSHRQAAQDLEKSNRFFQKLAKTMPGVLFVYDLIEKRILYVNPGAWEGLGYSDDDFRRMGDAFVAMTVHPEDQPRLDALAQEYAKAADGEVFTQLFRMRHKSGEWRWVHRKFTVFTWTPDGRPQQLVGTALDVTDTRMAEEELRKLPGRLLHAQDQERRRIARELHDTTAQNMTRPHRFSQTARRCAERACGRSARCPTSCIRRCSTRSASSPPCVGSSADSKRAAVFVSRWTLRPPWNACRRRWNEISFSSFKRR